MRQKCSVNVNWSDFAVCKQQVIQIAPPKKMYSHQHHHHPKKKRQRLKWHHDGDNGDTYCRHLLHRKHCVVLPSISFMFLVCSVAFLFFAGVTSGFVIISDQDTPEGWILFDAHVPISSTSSFPGTLSIKSSEDQHHHHHRSNNENIKQESTPNGFHYQYRISHHKTQPWVHRIVKVDKEGLLQLKKSISNCQFTAGLYPSTFLVYIDIVARYQSPTTLQFQDDHNQQDWEWGEGGRKRGGRHRNDESRKISRRELIQGEEDDGHNLSSNYDYISFPVTIILKRSNECHNSNNNPQGNSRKDGGSSSISSHAGSSETWKESWSKNDNLGSTSLSKNNLNDETEDHGHIARSVDDIYVSLPFESDNHCHHTNEKIANVFQFLPASVRAQCGVQAEVHSSSAHTFVVQPGTLDIVLFRDWCLFDVYQTVPITLRLNCTRLGTKNASMNLHPGLPEKVMAWDQNVHLILHQAGATHLNMDHHPIHRIRREMRNQAPYFDQPLYIAAVPEEQPAGIAVTTIGATDPENQSLTYSMTSLMDARSQQFFTLDTKSGVVSTSTRLDREKMNVHYFRIVATDSGVPPRTGTGTLQVSLN